MRSVTAFDGHQIFFSAFDFVPLQEPGRTVVYFHLANFCKFLVLVVHSRCLAVQGDGNYVFTSYFCREVVIIVVIREGSRFLRTIGFGDFYFVVVVLTSRSPNNPLLRYGNCGSVTCPNREESDVFLNHLAVVFCGELCFFVGATHPPTGKRCAFFRRRRKFCYDTSFRLYGFTVRFAVHNEIDGKHFRVFVHFNKSSIKGNVFGNGRRKHVRFRVFLIHIPADKLVPCLFRCFGNSHLLSVIFRNFRRCTVYVESYRVFNLFNKGDFQVTIGE